VQQRKSQRDKNITKDVTKWWKYNLLLTRYMMKRMMMETQLLWAVQML
jgi:hypothetical protein